MTAITVRLTKDEKKFLEKYGSISDTVRDAIRMYINSKKSAKALKKLREYQAENHAIATTEEIVSMLREDRDSS